MYRILSSLIGAAILSALFASAADADPIVYHVDLGAASFGTLNQHDTLCPNLGCGPTSVLNSFVFLQNQYRNIYDSKLVPPATTDRNNDGQVNDYDSWIDAANNLA